MPSRSRSEPSGSRRGGASASLAVYPLPAVVGTGRGDVEEIRIGAAVLAAAGFRIRLLCPSGVPWPIRTTERGSWPGPVSRAAPRRIAARAMTLSSQFGVTAAAARPGAYGRAGPWAETVARIESAYGPDRVVHLSLEEFCRNLSSDRQERERWREGGRPLRSIAAMARRREWTRRVRELRELFRRYRAFDRPNLLALFPTFRPSASFRREFPEAIECGPLFAPERTRRFPSAPSARDAAGGVRRWVWYPAPTGSSFIAERLARAVDRAGVRVALAARARASFSWRPSRCLRVTTLGPLPRAIWERRFGSADLRIVTGSRTLLEALDAGGPFLYFNGVTGRGRGRRRHRPEKIDGLLHVWRRTGVSPTLRRDLADFALGRSVDRIVRAALTDPAWAGRFPTGRPSAGIPGPRADAAALIVRIATDWAETGLGAAAFVAAERSRLGSAASER